MTLAGGGRDTGVWDQKAARRTPLVGEGGEAPAHGGGGSSAACTPKYTDSLGAFIASVLPNFRWKL